MIVNVEKNWKIDDLGILDMLALTSKLVHVHWYTQKSALYVVHEPQTLLNRLAASRAVQPMNNANCKMQEC